ncbi:hypothetical protein BDZ94DRAFT_1266288 [Collybia nuda]|uniref:Uncharacterized protein n=1 Tax=Collybia nuda TaxID=64659 RepID=A0A9P5Y0Y6_9AGAR|nr:hypothetical protein BDZ94DRAFT_1266288 [Collybia nuda]
METWAWWDWSFPNWFDSVPSHIPRHPILSNRYLAQHQQSLRLSWLSKVTLKKTYYSGVEKYIVEEYEKLCSPYGENQERMETEKEELRPLRAYLPHLVAKGADRHLQTNQIPPAKLLTSMIGQPWKKAKPTIDLKDTKEASPTLGVAETTDTGSDGDYAVAGSGSASRCVSPSSRGNEGSDEEDENDELDVWGVDTLDCDNPQLGGTKQHPRTHPISPNYKWQNASKMSRRS